MVFRINGYIFFPGNLSSYLYDQYIKRILKTTDHCNLFSNGCKQMFVTYILSLVWEKKIVTKKRLG